MEGGGALGRLKDSQPAARSGTDKKEPAPLFDRGDNDSDRLSDLGVDLSHGLGHRPVFSIHQVEDFFYREKVKARGLWILHFRRKFGIIHSEHFKMTLEELVGQKLVFGIEGTRVTPAVVELFRKTRAGGLILFRRNFESREQFSKLIGDLEAALARRLLVMVDHEGGRVIHLPEGVTVFPDAQAVGVCGKADLARRQGEMEALELRRWGIDINLAPVLDVLTDMWNPAIGTRSYGKDPERVGEMGRARIDGMQSKGLSACAKHYPGLGEAALDPHQDLPTIGKSWKALKQSDLRPFLKAFEGEVDCVMSSHPVYSELDPHPSRPATFSRRIIHDTLRLELGFSGVALTDDLQMGAISKRVSTREAVPLAVKAGHDLALLCSDAKAQEEAFDGLLWAYKKKDLADSELEESVERINHLRAKREGRFLEGSPAPEKGGKELAQTLARGGAEILHEGQGLIPISPRGCLRHSISAIFPDLSAVARQIFIEPELLDARNFLKRIFSQFGIPLRSIEIASIDPPPPERVRLKELAREPDLVFFFSSDAHLFPGTRELLKVLQEAPARLVVILLKEPHDLEWIRSRTACVTGYGFRACQIEAAVEKIFSPG